jgi:hypothetical protein
VNNENYFSAEEEWKKELENLYDSIQEDKSALKKEMENLNQILKDLQAGK